MNVSKWKPAFPHKQALYIPILLLILGASVPGAEAKDHKPRTSATVKVVATMSFDNKPPADMLIQQIKGKPYLFVQLANAQGVVVVDISKPDKLKIVSSLSGPGASGDSQLSIDGNAATVTAVASPASAAKGELTLWDISEPGNPREVQRFSGVVRVLRDHNYTYVLNQDGLWVVFNNQTQPADDDNNWRPSIYG